MSALEDPRWTALPEDRRDKLLEEYRDVHVGWGTAWWDGIYANTRDDMQTHGFLVDRMYFSGFWSQGDGACFTGSVNDWGKFLTAIGKLELIRFKNDFDLYLRTNHRGQYSHSGSVTFDLRADGYCPYDVDTDPLQHDAWVIATRDGNIFYDIEDDMRSFLVGEMDQLYKDLEAEHEHLTSDEVVAEYILNDSDALLIEEDEEEAEDLSISA